MSYKVRETVDIIADNGRYLVTGQIVNINELREAEMKYAVAVEGYPDYFFVGEKNLRKG